MAMMGLSFEGSCYLSSWSLRSTESFWDHLNQLRSGMMQKETGETWVKSLAGTTLEFRQQHLHWSILILGSSTNLYYSLLQKQLIRRVTKSCFGGCSLLRGIVSTVELQMRHRCLGTTRCDNFRQYNQHRAWAHVLPCSSDSRVLCKWNKRALHQCEAANKIILD